MTFKSETFQFENDRIRVTVNAEIVERYRSDAELAARLSTQTPEQALRGIILSEAMARLARSREADRLAEAAQPDPVEVRQLARALLIEEYMKSDPRRRCDSAETLVRYYGGYRLSMSQRMDLERAIAYADGCLDGAMPVDEIIGIADSTDGSVPTLERHLTTRVKIRNAAAGSEAGVRALKRAEELLRQQREAERHYYESRGNMDGWRIKIKQPENMPKVESPPSRPRRTSV